MITLYPAHLPNYVRKVADEFLALLGTQAFDALHARKCSADGPGSEIAIRVTEMKCHLCKQFDVWGERCQGVVSLAERGLMAPFGATVVNANPRDKTQCCLRESLEKGQGCWSANPEIERMGFVQDHFSFLVNVTVDTKDRDRNALGLVLVHGIAKFCVVQILVET